LILEDDVTSNISLPNLRQFAVAYLLDRNREEESARQQAGRLNIRAPSVSSVAGNRCPAAISKKWCLPNG